MLNDLNNIFKADSFNKADIVKILKKGVPNFEHIEKGKSLDQKM